MSGEDGRETGWLRRPRAPAPSSFSSAQFWLFAILFLGVAFLAGLGTAVTEEEWWARACGALISLTVLAASMWWVAHFLRPVGRDSHNVTHAGDSTAIDSWTASLERYGYVDIPLSRGRVAKTLAQLLGAVLLVALAVFTGGPFEVALGVVTSAMVVFLAVLPHVEFLTAARPAVSVDALGIRIARWTPLTVPWAEVVSVRVHQATPSAHVVIHVSDAFFERYLAARPAGLSLSDRIFAAFTRQGFTIPSTIAATPEALAAFLHGEAARRQRATAIPPDR